MECQECDVTHGADEFCDTDQFVDKHEEHTGNEVEWVRADVEFDFDTYREWRLTCHTCNRAWHFMTERAAHEFQEEHAEYTNHSITKQPEPRSGSLPKHTVESVDEESIRSLIADLADYYEEGAYHAAIYAHVGNNPTDHVRARQAIKKLKKQGEVYRPSQSFFKTV